MPGRTGALGGLAASTVDTIQRFNEATNRHDVKGRMVLKTDDVVLENTMPPPDGGVLEHRVCEGRVELPVRERQAVNVAMLDRALVTLSAAVRALAVSEHEGLAIARDHLARATTPARPSVMLRCRRRQRPKPCASPRCAFILPTCVGLSPPRRLGHVCTRTRQTLDLRDHVGRHPSPASFVLVSETSVLQQQHPDCRA